MYWLSIGRTTLLVQYLELMACHQPALAAATEFDQILTYMAFSLGIFPILAVIGVFKLRKLKKLEYKMPGFPAVPVIYIMAGVSILVLGFLERPVASSIAILTVAVGIPAYFIFKKKYKKE